MSSKDDIKRLVEQHNRRLQKLREQQASFGLHTPVHILTEIEDAKAEIESLWTELASLENTGSKETGGSKPELSVPQSISSGTNNVQTKVQYDAGRPTDYIFAILISLFLSLIVAAWFPTIKPARYTAPPPAIIIALVVASILVALFIAEAVRWVVRKRHLRYLSWVVAAMFILGSYYYLLDDIYKYYPPAMYGYYVFIPPAIYLILGTSTILIRLR
ncbi:MAG: hypothetical protein HS126_23200 [Anaerolineales bacterium]|nr:hypothetical protein [Anaerolineales bacterium]